MPNQFEIQHSDTEITIHLKMNGDLLENQIVLERVILTVFDIGFIFLTYQAFTDSEGISAFIALFLFLLFIMYVHYEHRTNKRWLDHANETFLISKNSLRISKIYLNQHLLTFDIDTQKIIEIFYNPWLGGRYPPYLPDYYAGNIHIHTYKGSYSFGINLNKEEAETFIVQLRSLIMQLQEPRHFIFAPHMHLEKDPIHLD